MRCTEAKPEKRQPSSQSAIASASIAPAVAIKEPIGSSELPPTAAATAAPRSTEHTTIERLNFADDAERMSGQPVQLRQLQFDLSACAAQCVLVLCRHQRHQHHPFSDANERTEGAVIIRT